MANRAAQIVSEWFVKCANVVLQSRIVLASDEGKQNRWVRRAVPRAPARPRDPSRVRFWPSLKNTRAHPRRRPTSPGSHPTRTYPSTVPPTRVPQFNLDVVELDAYAKSLQPWRSKQRSPDCGRLPPLILEVYVSDLGPDGDAPAEENARERPRVLIERWVLRHDADDADEGPRGETSIDRSHRQNPSPSKPGRTSAETTAVAYKRTVVMVRALHALCRSLPANRFHRAARQSQCRGLRFAMAHEIRAGGGRGRLDGRRRRQGGKAERRRLWGVLVHAGAHARRWVAARDGVLFGRARARRDGLRADARRAAGD